MHLPTAVLLSLLSLLAALPRIAVGTTPADQSPIDCPSCARWNAPVAPFPLAGHSWYVGTEGLSSVLIDSGDGLVLLDGGLPQSAARIADNIRSLGFQLQQVRWIVNSHAHYDHAGGIAALARLSGAQVAASPAGAATLRAGGVDAADPQHGYGDEMRFPPVTQVVELAPGEPLRLGNLELRRLETPGHTPGGSSWQWRDCTTENVCLSVVFADSLNAVSAPGFRFSDDPAAVQAFRASIQRIAELDCDVLVPVHPEFARLFEYQQERLLGPMPAARRKTCRAYAEAAAERLEARLAEEAESD